MASALREILASFGFEADTKVLDEVDDRIGKGIESLEKFGRAAFAAFAVDKVKDFVFGLAEQAEQLEVQSRMLGLSTDALQGWQYAASQVGVGAEDVTMAMTRLGRSVADAGQKGKGPGAEALAALGVAAKDAHGDLKSVDTLMEEIADGLQKIPTGAKQTQVAMNLFGRSGAKLLPLLKDGRAGIKKFRDEVEELGGGLNEDFIKRSKESLQETRRLGMAWTSLKVIIVGTILPYITRLVSGVKEVSLYFIRLSEHSSILQAATLALALIGIVKLSSAMGGLGNVMRILGTRILPILAAFLLVEDFITFMRGGDSLIGRGLDKAFGPGTADSVRKWVNGVWREFRSFIDDIRSRPAKLLDDWHVFTTQLGADVEDLFGSVIGGYLRMMGRQFLLVLDIMFGGADNFHTKMILIWGAIQLLGIQASDVFKYGWLAAIAAIEDSFVNLWNTIVGGWTKTLGVIRDVAAKIPGFGQQTQGLTDIINGLESTKGAGDSAARVNAAFAADNKRNRETGDFIASQLAASPAIGGATIQGGVNVSVSVPPGTDADLARRVGDAAAKGTKNALNTRQIQAALVPGGQ